MDRYEMRKKADHMPSGEIFNKTNLNIREILESIKEDFYVLSRDWIFLYANKKFTSRIGKEPADFIGQNIWQMFPKHIGTMYEENLRTAMEKGETREFEVHGQYTDAWYQMKVYPSEDGLTILGTDITDRKKTEESLNIERERLRVTLESIPDELWITDAQGKIIERNAGSILESLGKSDWPDIDSALKELELMNIDGTIRTPEDAALPRALRGESIQKMPEIIRNLKTGELRWREVSSSPIRDNKGNITGAIAIARDVTERKRTERALIESEDRFAKAFMSSPAALAITKFTDGTYIDVNNSVLAMIGYSRDEMIGHTPGELGVYYNTNEREDLLRTLMTEGSVINREIKFWSKERKIIDSILSMEIVESRGEKLILSSFIDITERKKADKKLRESEERFRALSETSPLGVGVSSSEGVILYTNPSYERILGYDPGEIIGMKSSDLYWNPEERETWLNFMKDKGLVRDYEIRLKKKDGTPVWISINTSPFIYGSKPAVMGTIQDISSRKRFEEELKRNNEILEERIRERTENLQMLNEALAKSNKELENFAYIASHDLQEPLRMVSSFTQLLEKQYGDKLDDTAKEYIGFAVDGAKRMYELINGLLAYSRITRKEELFTKVDLNKVIEEVKYNLELVITERNCLIESDNLPVVNADKTQMLQLFQNLISNGIKFSPEDPHISITVRKEESEYLISVKDHGIGIESQYFARIFQIFQRLHQRDRFEGTGIGLSICKKIVENHKGRIWVESEPGNGSVFHFSLPE